MFLILDFTKSLKIAVISKETLIQKELNSKILYLISNFVLAVPVISLIIYWGSVAPPHITNTRSIGNFYFEQIGYSISIIFFYLIP